MNTRARALVASLRGILDGEPRARAISAHAGAWRCLGTRDRSGGLEVTRSIESHLDWER